MKLVEFETLDEQSYSQKVFINPLFVESVSTMRNENNTMIKMAGSNSPLVVIHNLKEVKEKLKFDLPQKPAKIIN